MIDIKRFRRENKISQVALAEYLGVLQGFISQMESGARPIPAGIEERIRANDRGWIISEGADICTEPADVAEEVAALRAEVALLRKEVEQLRSEKAAYWQLIERLTEKK